MITPLNTPYRFGGFAPGIVNANCDFRFRPGQSSHLIVVARITGQNQPFTSDWPLALQNLRMLESHLAQPA